jgi:hypothetical protein
MLMYSRRLLPPHVLFVSTQCDLVIGNASDNG